MKQKIGKMAVIFLTLIAIFCTVNSVYGVSGVEVTVNTDRKSYNFGELVSIYGNLKRDGTLVTNALIAVQINDAKNNIVSLRTRSTGTTPSPWSIDITELISCEASGNPKDTFKRGTLAYFKVKVKNLNTLSERYVTVTINIYDSNQVPIGIAWIGTTVEAGKEFTYLTSIPIPSEAATGTAYAYANAYNKWPKDNGIAYCGEECITFTITDGTSSANANDSSRSEFETSGSEGTYELSFRLGNNPAIGDYTVYASYYQTLATTTFDVVWLLTDVNRDGKVNIQDLFSVAKAYGSKLGDENWNPKADLDGNGLINIMDIYEVAKDYGKARS